MASPSTNIAITATDKTGKAFRAVNKNISGMQKGIVKLKVAFGALAGAMAVRAIINFGKEQLKVADAIGKTSARLGITTDALQTLNFAAEQSGMTTQQLEMSFQRFTRRLAEAGQGTGVLKDTFKDLGIQIRNTDGSMRSAEELLGEVADKMSKIPDQGEKVRLAFKMFDSEGVKMVNMLQGGSKGLAELRKQLRSTGGFMNESFIRDAQEANDAMNLLSNTFSAMGTRLLSGLSPAILEVTDAMQRLMNLDPKKTMSLGRLRDEYNDLDEKISKTATRIRKLEQARVDSGVVEVEKQILKNLMQEQYELEVQIALRKESSAFQKTQKNLQIEHKKNEEAITKAITEQQQIQKHASQMRFMGATKVLGAQQMLNKEHEETIDLLEEEFSADFKKKEEEKIERIRRENEFLAEQKKIKKEAMEEEERAQKILADNARKRIEDARREAEEKERLRRQGLQQTISVAKATGDILYEQGVMGFDAMRALAYTEAIINAHLAATKALATLPPPWSYAAATASYAFAAARAYEIKNMKPPAREMGGTVTKGKPFLVGESGAEIFTPGQTGSITPNAGGANITFNILANDAQGFDQLLLARRGLIVSMINKAMHQQGRRALI